MLKSHAAALKLSEIREKLNALNAVVEPTDAEQTEERELLAAQKTTETEYREALTAESEAETQPTTADPELRERVELRRKSRLGAFILAHLQGREPNGPEAEYRSALGVTGGIPVDLFEREPEIRADAASVAPATGLGSTLAPIQPALFAPSIAPRLGIDMPTVGSGAYSEARISTPLTAGAKVKGAAQESTAAVLTTVTANPRAITGRLTLQLEDIALIGQDNFEAALRSNLQMALSHEYDGQTVNGNGTAPNVNGLIKQLTDPANPTEIAGFDDYLQSFSDAIDGLWASELREIAIVANVDAYKRSARTFRDFTKETNTAAAAARGAVSFADYAKANTAGWWCNSRMPATAANIARGIVHRRGRAGVRTAVHPVWNSITIDDVYTDAASRQRHVTMSVLVGDKVILVQPAAYALAEWKVA